MANLFSTVYTIPVYNASCLETSSSPSASSSFSSSTAPFLIQVSCSSKEDVLNTKLRAFQILATDVLPETVNELADTIINLVQKNVCCYIAPRNATIEQVQVKDLLVNYGRWACLYYKSRNTFYILYDRAELLKLLFIHQESPIYCKLIDNVYIKSSARKDINSSHGRSSFIGKPRVDGDNTKQSRAQRIEQQLNGCFVDTLDEISYPLVDDNNDGHTHRALSTFEFVHCLAFLLLEDVVEDRLADIYLELQPKAKSNKLHFGAKHLVGPISVRVNDSVSNTVGHCSR